jgi:acetoin utilization deacetylase AcuC-like enzyme
VLVSAGFDAHDGDPLANMRVSTEGFRAMCAKVRALADRHCQGRLVLALEGGYDLESLAFSVRACVEDLTGAHRADPDASPARTKTGDALIERTREVQAPYWGKALAGMR